ncbi:LysR family transcriptional regulator [Gluconacetobacter azotocaptans]|uniref:LysR family transcriptional regulator n=1 Tax=Gluconacetobacter azotocaptans TaxID=142834 RepID=A0A7W4PBP8_9PROT|nr:LysR family transcriptional regulator [Gluconacetobacter azotocaptans]MBB2188382.1 LysR family transcriptional regulator [Gluconacetobacter azotocaptans]MBM9400093.1 LysR family transcriptional regulator [Gluconacetobacter azotocaptans]GBQ27694.1 LysR family transcriptional regulator [Gluconacetobacter azotocaptans DSM 13594]
MNNLSGISVFVSAAETLSFVEAGRLLGVSASAIGKTVVRLEERLGVRLFHRNTRSMKLTAEGALFLQRCHRILGELDAAEQELSDIRAAPKGKLRVSLPAIGTMLLPALSEFIQRYPEVELDIDFSDRKVDLIDEGFDAAVRIGETDDTRLLSRQLGVFHRNLVASPGYLKKAGRPKSAAELLRHTCLLYRFPTTGKIESWPVPGWESILGSGQLSTVSCNSIETLTYFALQGQGVACLPDFEVRSALADNKLERLLVTEASMPRAMTILWPTSKQLAPKLRAFIDLLTSRLSLKQ